MALHFFQRKAPRVLKYCKNGDALIWAKPRQSIAHFYYPHCQFGWILGIYNTPSYS